MQTGHGPDCDNRTQVEALPTPPTDRVAPLEPLAQSGVDPMAPRGQDWGEAPDVGQLHGRALEMETLGRWVAADGCRLVAIVGIGGIGKTSLAARLARELAADFEAVYWRSVRNAPPCVEWLGGAILFLSDQQVLPAEGEEARLRQLLELLRARRCLLVLDNFSTVLAPGAPEVQYRSGDAGYGQVVQWLAEAGHLSCLIVTSREVPPELGPRAGLQGPVRVLRLGGLDTMAGRALLADRGLVGDAAAWEAMVARYGGNPLALQVVSETIATIFGGEIAAFLAQGEAVFGDIRRLLDGQIARLSAEERTVLDWLAIEREPVDFRTLLADLDPIMARGAALEALEALRRRSLLERGQQGATVTLQPVVLEYATDRLVDQLADEIAHGEPARLVSHAVIEAQAKEYVRRSQERLIAEPILAWLNARYDRSGTEQRLLVLLDGWRGLPPTTQGYGPGNVVNLLRLPRGDLRGLDLSRLAIRQAYLAEVDAQDASLAHARLTDTVLAEAFDYPGSVALSGDGALLAAGTSTGGVWLWRVADRTPLLSVQAHTGGAWGVALSADGRLLASGGEDGTVRLWEASTGRSLATLQSHAGVIYSLALSADGRYVASGGTDGTLRLWDASAGRPLATLEGHAGGVRCVALSADGQRVASGGDDGTVRLWDVATERPTAPLQGHAGLVWSVGLCADGHLLASGGEDGTVRVWEAGTGRPVATLQGQHGGVRSMALAADGRLVASGGFDGTVRLWEAGTGRPLLTLAGHTGAILGLALSADGRLMASGSFEGTVRLWEADTGRPMATLQGQRDGVRSTALSADGRLVAVAGFDGTVRLWEAGTGRPMATLQDQRGGARSMALSADGRLVAVAGFDGTVRLWEAGTGRPMATLQDQRGGVNSVALSADGRLVASGGFEGTVRLWKAGTGQPVATLQGHTGAVWGLALSADGRLLASGGADGTARLWDASTGRQLMTLKGQLGGVHSLALSADARLVASGGGDGTVHCWDAGTGQPLAILPGHTGTVHSVALCADGHLVASGGGAGIVRLWDAATGRPLGALQGHSGAVWGLALSADGRLVASGSPDGTVRLWDVNGGTCLRIIRSERCYERLDITGLTGVTAAQRAALVALGAVDRSDPASTA
jgi:WD40 repeat protein